jgi:hypothetical protein
MKKKKQNWQQQKLQITKWGFWGNQTTNVAKHKVANLEQQQQKWQNTK